MHTYIHDQFKIHIQMYQRLTYPLEENRKRILINRSSKIKQKIIYAIQDSKAYVQNISNTLTSLIYTRKYYKSKLWCST